MILVYKLIIKISVSNMKYEVWITQQTNK